MFLTTALLCMFIALSGAENIAAFTRLSPVYRHAFQYPLPIAPVKKPLTSYTNTTIGTNIDFYEVKVKSFQHKFFPDLPGSADLVGYDGSFPGPTFRVEKGRETVVRVVNNGQKAMNIHLHGSYSRSPWDGWAMDWVEPGQYKDYYYPNAVHRTLWYHDHTNKIGATNVYKGLVGMYQIVDSKLDSALGLPSGSKFDIPLVLTAHYFTKDGGMSNEERQQTSIYGDTYLINGQIQPYLEVEPRKYRFRILNAAISRVFNLTLTSEKSVIPMAIVGSDGGYRQAPTATKNLMVGMADRWEVVVDFAPFAGKNLTLKTTNAWTDTAYNDVEQMMRFVVGKKVSDSVANAPLPRRFNFNMKFPTETGISAERTFKLDSHMDTVWGMNGIHHDDAMTRVMMRPPLGTIEKYIFKSTGMGMTTAGKTSSADPSLNPDFVGGHHGNRMMGMRARSAPSNQISKSQGHWEKRQMNGMMGGESGGMMGSGGMSMKDAAWTHAMHVHLVDLKMISRRKDDPSKAEGRNYLEEYEKDSIKDVVLLGSNEVVEVLAKFQPYPGVYMFHCHNAVHSDQGMMAVFNVTRLADFGYSGLETTLEDPMDERFRARTYTGTNLEEIKSKVLPFFASLNAYPDPAALAEAEDRYWSSRTPISEASPINSAPKSSPTLNSGGNAGGHMGGSMGGGIESMAGHHGGQSQGGGMSNANSAQAIPNPSSSGMGSMSGMGGMAGHHGGNMNMGMR